MSRQRIVLLTDRPWRDNEIERAILADVDATLIEPKGSTSEEIAELARQADAIGVCWAKLTGELLERCPRCQVVARFGVGLDNIPVEVATRLGIPVTYLPDYCAGEVADHTLALMLALLRAVPAFDHSLKIGNYDPGLLLPKRLAGLTLGIVGFGRIGRAVAHRASAFGFRVIATSRKGKGEPPVEFLSLERLLSEADVVSLHLPLTSETRHLINRSTLTQMKNTAYLINTSRGGLVEAEALLEALDSGRLAGAALDVFEPEPPLPQDPLIAHPKVVATPHVAFRSSEALVELRTRATRQIADVLAGRMPEHLVNPEVFRSNGR